MINKITQNIWQLNFRVFGSCVYLLKIPELILIDTSSKEAESELLQDLKDLNVLPEEIESIILTHTHWDHNGNIGLFPKSKVYSAMNLKEIKQKFPEFTVYETPGHTRDSICILYQEVLFSGDTIFDKNHNYIGRTDLPESNPKQMQESLELVKKINYNILCPGHLV